MQIKPAIIAGYLALLLPPLGVLVFHRYVAAHAAENTRNGGLPEHFFLWRWFASLACAFLLLTTTLLVASFRDEQFARGRTLFKLAAAQLVFIVFTGSIPLSYLNIF